MTGARAKKGFRDASIEVGQNESVAIIGANGAGKSTLVSGLHSRRSPLHNQRTTLRR
jgi:ABC-type cobalamin/Fe3+-siderophores transport system ATPase subunit